MYDPTDVLNARGQLSVEALREMADQAALAASITVGGGYLSASPGALAVVPGATLDTRDVSSFHQPFPGTIPPLPAQAPPECWYPAGNLPLVPASVNDLGKLVLWNKGGTVQAVPFYAGVGGQCDGIGFMLYHAGAVGAQVVLAIYGLQSGNLTPGARVWTSGAIPADDWTLVGPVKFVGKKVTPALAIVPAPLPFALALTPGSLVWLAMLLVPSASAAPAWQDAKPIVEDAGSLFGTWYYVVTATTGNTETVASTERKVVLDPPPVTPPDLAAALQEGGTLPSAVYYYLVTAVNAKGEESITVVVTSAAPAGTKLAVKLTWGWSGSPDHYRVYRSTVGTFGSADSYFLGTAGAGTQLAPPSYTDQGGTGTLLQGPRSRQAVQLDWSPVPGATGYNVYRNAAPKSFQTAPPSWLASTSATEYVDDGSVSATYNDPKQTGAPPLATADVGTVVSSSFACIFGVPSLFDPNYVASGVWSGTTVAGRFAYRSNDATFAAVPDPFPPGVPNGDVPPAILPAILLRFSSAPGPGQG